MEVFVYFLISQSRENKAKNCITGTVVINFIAGLGTAVSRRERMLF
jgi:hypothetical protein